MWSFCGCVDVRWLCSSVQSLYQYGRRGDLRDDSAEILFQSFLREVNVNSSGMGGDVHSLMLSSGINFPLPTTVSPTLQGALRDGFGKAVVAHDMRVSVS